MIMRVVQISGERLSIKKKFGLYLNISSKWIKDLSVKTKSKHTTSVRKSGRTYKFCKKMVK